METGGGATELVVNGGAVAVWCDPETPLVFVLRNDLGLVGTRYGCGAGYCGSCTVLLDGEPAAACDVPVGAAAGRTITTIEGLVRDGALHPVQQAFIDLQAAQCGFCSSGIIMRAVALLGRSPHPSEAEIRAALSENLCRCGVHPRVIAAIVRAAGGESS